MENSLIQQTLHDVTETREIVLGYGVLPELIDLFTRNFGDHKAVIIADENTFKAAGKRVYDMFLAAGKIGAEPIIYPGSPMLYANLDNVLRLEETLRPIDAVPVAVGSGTINDLTKLASHNLNLAYMVVSTAASMDGYTASGASISKDGFKQTFSCPAPRAILADLTVISNAPASMTASGYGDLLAKNVAGADWIIADALGIEPINPRTWEIVQGPLYESTAHPELLQRNDKAAIQNLVQGLMMSGLSLQHYRASRPASGAEHLISHLWEMGETTHGQFSHGLKVGLGTIASAALFERLLERDFTHLDVEAAVRAFPTRDQLIQSIQQIHPNSLVTESAFEQSMAKYVIGDALVERLNRLRSVWPELREKLRVQLIPAQTMSEMMAAAGCITHPRDMGKSLADLRLAYEQARLIRNRYTILDLAAETGCMENCLDELFAPGGFWAD